MLFSLIKCVDLLKFVCYMYCEFREGLTDWNLKLHDTKLRSFTFLAVLEQLYDQHLTTLHNCTPLVAVAVV